MAQVPNIKRLAKEDFPSDDQKLIEKLAYPINSFFEQTRNALNRSLDFNNLNQEIITLLVTVDATGKPKIQTRFKSNLNTRLQGMTCVRAENVNNPGTPPDNTPFATWIQSGNVVTINNVKGLPANTQFRLYFLTM